MQLETEQKKLILEKIHAQGDGDKAGCVDVSLGNIAPVRKVEASDLLECYTEAAKGCKFALPFGKTYFCRCQARNYLYRELGI